MKFVGKPFVFSGALNYLLVQTFCLAICCHGQSNSSIQAIAPESAFEVASIRLSSSNNTSVSIPHGARIREVGITFLQLVAFAYGIKQDQITAPAWASSQTYDINAKTKGDVSLSLQQMRPLLQSLLMERFHLETHYQSRPTSGYNLVIDKSGLKLKPATPQDSKSIYFEPDGIHGTCSLAALAAVLENPADKPVVDKTNVAGEYSFQLHYAAADATDSPYPSLFTAVREQLGLRLIPSRVTVEELVIDSVNRVPTAN